jgi:multiple sugar transport system permease protein
MNRTFPRILLYVLIIIPAIFTLIPFVYMAMTSVKDEKGNSSGLFVPHVDDRTLAISTADVNVDDNSINTTESLQAGDILIYHSKGGTSASTGPETASAATAPIGGLVDGQTYYAIPYKVDRAKLATTPDDASRQTAMYLAATTDDNHQTIHDQAAIDKADKAIAAIDLTSPGSGAGQYFSNPAHVMWQSFTVRNYFDLFRQNPTLKYQIANSFFFASVTSLLATLFCAMGGYALAMFHFKGRKLMTGVVLAALIIPAMMLTAPNYQLLFHMKLLDTFSGLILPAIGPAFLVFLFRQSMIAGLPAELLEAGRIDGCGEIRMFFQIVLPLIRPMVSASILITFLGSWNNFINPQVILQSPRNFTLSVAVAQLQDAYSFNYGALMAGTMISVLPVMILFLLLQKEFIAGLTAGAVKG